MLEELNGILKCGFHLAINIIIVRRRKKRCKQNFETYEMGRKQYKTIVYFYIRFRNVNKLKIKLYIRVLDETMLRDVNQPRYKFYIRMLDDTMLRDVNQPRFKFYIQFWWNHTHTFPPLKIQNFRKNSLSHRKSCGINHVICIIF